MSYNNSSGQTNCNHLSESDEQQYQLPNLSDNTPHSEFGEKGYEAQLAEEESLNTQAYELESRLIQVNRGHRILTSEELTLIDTNSRNLQATIELLERELFDFEEVEGSLPDSYGSNAGVEYERYRYFEDYEPWLLDRTFDHHTHFRDFDEEEDITLLPNNVDELLQTSSCVEMSTLKPDDLSCLICHLEYDKEREVNTEPILKSHEGLSGKKTAEYPIKLPCGHVFGDWCIKRWLRDAEPASCPLCRYTL